MCVSFQGMQLDGESGGNGMSHNVIESSNICISKSFNFYLLDGIIAHNTRPLAGSNIFTLSKLASSARILF